MNTKEFIQESNSDHSQGLEQADSLFDKYDTYNTVIVDNNELKPRLFPIPAGYYAIIMLYERHNTTQGAVKNPTWGTLIDKQFTESTSNKSDREEGDLIMDEVGKDIAVIKNDIGYIKSDVNALKSNVDSFCTSTFPNISTEVAVIKNNVIILNDSMKEKFNEVKDEIKTIRTNIRNATIGIIIAIIGSVVGSVYLLVYQVLLKLLNN